MQNDVRKYLFPAIATFGLRKTAVVREPEFASGAKEFVDNDFYVDDGLKSMPRYRPTIRK